MTKARSPKIIISGSSTAAGHSLREEDSRFSLLLPLEKLSYIIFKRCVSLRESAFSLCENRSCCFLLREREAPPQFSPPAGGKHTSFSLTSGHWVWSLFFSSVYLTFFLTRFKGEGSLFLELKFCVWKVFQVFQSITCVRV